MPSATARETASLPGRFRGTCTPGRLRRSKDVSYLIAETCHDNSLERGNGPGDPCREIYLAAKLFRGPLRTAFATRCTRLHIFLATMGAVDSPIR